MYVHVFPSLVPNPSLFLHGCETKAGVGRTGNEAMYFLLAFQTDEEEHLAPAGSQYIGVSMFFFSFC